LVFVGAVCLRRRSRRPALYRPTLPTGVSELFAQGFYYGWSRDT